MGKLKIYKEMKDRTEEEKRTGKASYKTLIERLLHNEIFMCNNIQEIEPYQNNNSKIRFTFFRIFHKIKINLLLIKWKKLKLNKK